MTITTNDQPSAVNPPPPPFPFPPFPMIQQQRLPLWIIVMIVLLVPIAFVMATAVAVDRIVDSHSMQGIQPRSPEDSGDYLIIERDIAGSPVAFYESYGVPGERTILVLGNSSISFYDEDARRRILVGGRYDAVEVRNADEWKKIHETYLPRLFDTSGSE